MIRMASSVGIFNTSSLLSGKASRQTRLSDMKNSFVTLAKSVESMIR